MVARSAEIWPPDEELFEAQRAQAAGILRMLESPELVGDEERVRRIGNYLLLTAFITPDRDKSGRRIDRNTEEERIFVEGMFEVGFSLESALRNADIVYETTNLRRFIYPLRHIPDSAPELILIRRKGEIKGRHLNIHKLCEEALHFVEPLSDENLA